MPLLDKWQAFIPPQLAEWLGYYRIIGALAILLFGFVAAKVFRLVVQRVLTGLARKTDSALDDTILQIIQRPISQTVILACAGLAISVLRPEPGVGAFFVSALTTVAILIWLVAGHRMTAVLFGQLNRRLIEAGRSGADFIPLLANVTRVVIFGAAVVAFLNTWHLDVTPLLASAGIAGLGLALAAKDTLANFFGGVSVFMDRPYKIGDYINLDSGERGEVVEIGIRSTRIQTRDDVQIIIPNSIIAGAKIINESAPEPRFRIRIQIGVAYGSDVDQVERILLEVATGNPMVVSHPEPRVRFRSFGDSGLNFELLCWIADPKDRGLVIHHLNRAVYQSFARHGVTIPFPQMDIHVRQEEADPHSGAPGDLGRENKNKIQTI